MAALRCEDVKKLYLCENKEKGRDLLVKMLNYPPFDEEEDPRAVIILDFCFESFQFASKQGFSWQQGLALFELMQELRENALGLLLVEATELFKAKLKNYVQIFQQRTASVVDFVFSFFFNHFHLYKFVFNNDKEVNRTCYQLSIESPPEEIVPLTQGVEKSVWDEQQALRNLEKEHNENMMKRQLHFDLDIQKLEALIQEKLSSLDKKTNLTTDELKSLIKGTVQIFVASASNAITFSIEESQGNLEYEFSKAAVTQTRQRTGTTATPKKRAAKTKGGKA